MESTNLIASVFTATASTFAAFTGDEVMAWVMLILNVITLTSNTILTIYRNWRDRDKDDKQEEKKNEENKNDD